jgi:hypothetical protein
VASRSLGQEGLPPPASASRIPTSATIRNGTVRGWLSNGVSVDNVLH